MYHTDTDRTAASVVDRMANVIGDRRNTDGCCTEGDLLNAGFSRAQIARYGDAARDVAAARRAAAAH